MSARAPATFAVRVHCLASSADGLKIDGDSVPSPHSRSVNVFTPKWRNSASSSRCHASCDADGRGRDELSPRDMLFGSVQAAADAAITWRNERRLMLWICYWLLFVDAAQYCRTSPFRHFHELNDF